MEPSHLQVGHRAWAPTTKAEPRLYMLRKLYFHGTQENLVSTNLGADTLYCQNLPLPTQHSYRNESKKKSYVQLHTQAYTPPRNYLHPPVFMHRQGRVDRTERPTLTHHVHKCAQTNMIQNVCSTYILPGYTCA